MEVDSGHSNRTLPGAKLGHPVQRNDVISILIHKETPISDSTSLPAEITKQRVSGPSRGNGGPTTGRSCT